MPGGADAARRGADARRPFDDASLARAVDAELRLQRTMYGRGSATTAPTGDRLRKGALIGAGFGAVTRGVWAATGGRCTIDTLDSGGRCARGGATADWSVVAVGVLGGTLVGAGVGAMLGLLVK